MKNLFKIFILTFIFLSVHKISDAQDIDLFNKHKNDNFDMPEIIGKMSFQEYQLLSRDLRMKHMLYAMVVPGFTHFYAQENKLGYSMLATRVIGYGGLGYVWLKNKDRITFKDLLLTQFNRNIFPEEERNKYSAITGISLAFIFGSYLFDWIHGQYRLEKKQEEIRFKFSPRLISGNFHSKNTFMQTVPAIGISINF